MQLGTNALGHFYLTQLLLPTLLSTVKSSSNKVRVVTVSSLAHQLGDIDFNTFRDSPARKRLGPFFLYAQSKSVSVDTAPMVLILTLRRPISSLPQSLLEDMAIRE